MHTLSSNPKVQNLVKTIRNYAILFGIPYLRFDLMHGYLHDFVIIDIIILLLIPIGMPILFVKDLYNLIVGKTEHSYSMVFHAVMINVVMFILHLYWF
jgi:hypothetical protein